MGGESESRTVASQYPKLVERPVGQQITQIYTDRLGQFQTPGQFQAQGLLAKLYEGRVSDDQHVKLLVHDVPGLKRPSFKEATATATRFRPTSKGQSFGPSWSTHWFRITIKIPAELQKKEHLEFHWDAGNEGLVWTEDGVPLQGLTGGDRVEWIIPDGWRDGKPHTFYIEMACNGMFGNAPGGDMIQPPDMNKYYTLNTADIVAVNVQARQLYVDFWIIGDAAREWPAESWEKHKALQICNAIMDAFIAGKGSQDSILKGREIAREYIGNVDSAKVYQTDEEPLVYAIGHCHIDTCWLWPFAETKRKIARSWASQCDLMDRYPEHRFVCSQAQQYKWLEELYPPLYDRVKSKVKKGTFQPIGGSWVEHDTNMPSGESLSRQFLYGQRFFESHFGERSQTFWLPDTFGYSAQLPQLCRLAGMNRFLTQKLSWNNINNFPHTTFNWVALDGSQVLCHMPPAETYTAEAHWGDVRRSITQHKSMDQDNTSLLVFGKGDGGGGPTREQIEKLRRSRGMSDKTGRLPRVQMGKSVDDFFTQLEKKAASGTDFTTWHGELYFELHRGTYTTQANNKRNNRKGEIFMFFLEMVATLATLRDESYAYPKKEIDYMWERMLLCQFHDCLPGSSIHMAYDESDQFYAEAFKAGKHAMENALAALGFKESEGGENGLLALNSSPWSRSEILCHSAEYPLVIEDCAPLSAHNKFRKCRLQPANIKEVKTGVFLLSNQDLEVTVERGAITSLYDKRVQREIVAPGKTANQFVIFDDKPLYWQAWDVEVYHLDSRKELPSSTSTMSECGPERVAVTTDTRISEHSWLRSTVRLAASAGSPDERPSAIEIEAEVEWHETMRFLKVEFPVDIVNTEASYEMQYGIVRRPTHYNTSWDMAKFEVCCHKWADLSENGYGVSILNDSKYGFATVGNVMRLSLLRAPKAPDATADMGKHYLRGMPQRCFTNPFYVGRHKIRWAILPHQGALSHHTVRAARDFNYSLRMLSPLTHPAPEPALFHAVRLSGDPALILDCIKRGEDDADVSRGGLPARKGRSIILRVYDSLGGRARGRLEWDVKWVPVRKVLRINLLEDDGEEVDMDGEGGAEIELRAFEVATYRLQLYSN